MIKKNNRQATTMRRQVRVDGGLALTRVPSVNALMRAKTVIFSESLFYLFSFNGIVNKYPDDQTRRISQLF